MVAVVLAEIVFELIVFFLAFKFFLSSFLGYATEINGHKMLSTVCFDEYGVALGFNDEIPTKPAFFGFKFVWSIVFEFNTHFVKRLLDFEFAAAHV